MDVEIYNSILKQSGIDPMAFDLSKKKKRQYPNGLRAFRHDIFKGKVIWKNDYFADYLLFIACYHPLFGLFASPKNHPYTKKKRLTTLSMMLCVGSFFAALSSYYDTNNNSFVHQYGAKLLVSICNGFVLFLMELTLRYCLQCPCRENIENNSCNSICKGFTKCTLGCWGIISFGLLISMVFLVILEDLFSGFIIIFILQFVCSWSMQCGGLYLKFRKLQKKDVEQMANLPAIDPYNNLWSTSNITFTETVKQITFKELLRERKKCKFPYYITYFDSNAWIEEHPEYFIKKKIQKKWCKKVVSITNGGQTEHVINSDDDEEEEDEDEDLDDNKPIEIELQDLQNRSRQNAISIATTMKTLKHKEMDGSGDWSSLQNPTSENILIEPETTSKVSMSTFDTDMVDLSD